MQCWHLLRSVSFSLAAPNVKVCVDSFGFRNVDVREDENILVKSIGSRFTETDKILQKIDEDKFISSSDLRSATEGCFDSLSFVQ
jgi:hypothetical protein